MLDAFAVDEVEVVSDAVIPRASHSLAPQVLEARRAGADRLLVSAAMSPAWLVRLGRMRRMINSTYITLDGIIENPQDWPSGRHEDDGSAREIQTELLLRCDALLLGRRTYEGFAPVWTAMSGDPFSDHINAMEKWVVSTTLTQPTWSNSEVIATDVAAELARRKAGDGGDIVQYGWGPVSDLLLEHGLLDELRLWVHPFLLGAGTADDLLFRPGRAAGFELADTTALASGIAVLTYRVA